MAVKIRLSRLGKTNRPYWRIVAMDSRKKRDGAYLDSLGTYDPIKHEVMNLNLERIQEMISQGAQCSATVAKILKQQKRAGAKTVVQEEQKA